MDKDELNSLMVNIVEKRMELGRLNYSDITYDELEEEVHHLEDELVEHFGSELELILKEIHSKYCPETEVQSPVAYLAKKYQKTGKCENRTAIYDVADYEQGIIIDSDEYKDGHLVFVPNPVRLLLVAKKGKFKKEVWLS